MSTPLDCALDLMLRLPPQSVEENLGVLIQLLPEATDELLSMVDTPLKVRLCSKTGKEFLICDYNRDGDSYRSPWSNAYEPAIEDGAVPSPKLRKMELNANEAFNIYRELYYEGGLSSVYIWELPEAAGFAAAILIKKIGEQNLGCWDAIHMIEAANKSTEPGCSKEAEYKITSTVLLYLDVNEASAASINLSGQITRQNIQVLPYRDDHDHISNMGRLVEEMENRLRSSLQEIYFGKTKDVVNELKLSTAVAETMSPLNLCKLFVSSPGATMPGVPLPGMPVNVSPTLVSPPFASASPSSPLLPSSPPIPVPRARESGLSSVSSPSSPALPSAASPACDEHP